MAKTKGTCEECGNELLENGTCPNCGFVPEKEEKDDLEETSDEE